MPPSFLCMRCASVEWMGIMEMIFCLQDLTSCGQQRRGAAAPLRGCSQEGRGMFLKRAERERAEGMEGVEWAHSGKRRGRTEGGEPNEGNVFALPRRRQGHKQAGNAQSDDERDGQQTVRGQSDQVFIEGHSSPGNGSDFWSCHFHLRHRGARWGRAATGARRREQLLPSGREGRRKGRSSKHSQAKAEGETRKPIKHGNHALPLRPRAAGTVTLHSLGSYVLSFWRLRDCSPYLSFAVLLSWPIHKPELKSFNENIVSRSCLIGMRDLDKWIVLPHNMQELPM